MPNGTKTKQKRVKPAEMMGCTVTGLARQAGVARSTVQAWLRDPECPPRFADGSLNAYAIGAWRRERRLVTEVGLGADDPMLAGGASPALERFRSARADLAELDLKRQLRQVVTVAEFNEVLARGAQLIRQAGDMIQTSFGDGPHQILQRALDQVDILFAEQWPQVEDDEDDDLTDPPNQESPT